MATLKRYLGEFWSTVGGAWWLALSVFGLILGLLDHYLPEMGVTTPHWWLSIPLAISFIVMWTIIALLRRIVALLDQTIALQKRITGTRTDLSHLRSEGVRLRNEGRRINDEGNAAEWKIKAEDWNERVIAKIKEINEADAIWYSILDIVPTPRVPAEMPEFQLSHEWAQEHVKLFKWHDFRVRRIGEMIRELWRD